MTGLPFLFKLMFATMYASRRPNTYFACQILKEVKVFFNALKKANIPGVRGVDF